jgi:murein L,D-transpeptidase YcbB/YkuD
MARRAHSLATLLAQVNALAPNRDKSSDGWIGDAAHQATKSEHNPNAQGVVRAIDITHDPADGFDSWAFAEMLRARADPRLYYVISNGRIANPGQAWRKYTGSNKHDHHVHISVEASATLYDDAQEWDISGDWNASSGSPPFAPTAPKKPIIKKGSPLTSEVTRLQNLLGIYIDGIFGPKTEQAVKDFQKSKGLTADGIVGPYTREKLGM